MEERWLRWIIFSTLVYFLEITEKHTLKPPQAFIFYDLGYAKDNFRTLCCHDRGGNEARRS
jgi:hypothetical protein